jgi:hypothetical protein
VGHDVREELAVHIEDGVEDGVERGLAPDEAARNVLERLGSPATLARGLRSAHQTRRRLAAGVAGGAVAAVEGAIRGTILGYGLALAAASVVVVAATPAQQTAGLRFDWVGLSSTSWTDTLAASGVAIGAFLAGRRATLVSATRSRRNVRTISPWWVIPGSALIGAWAVFRFEVVLSWPAVIALLAIPIAFAAGTRVAIERTGLQIRPRHILLVFAGCVALPVVVFLALGAQTSGILSTVGGGPHASLDDLWHAQGLDQIGRPPPPAIENGIGDATDSLGDGVASSRLELRMPAALAGWSGLRFEAWRMTGDDFRVLPGETAPFAIGTASIEGQTLTGSIRVDRARGVDSYGLVLVGVGPDGVRYVLWGPNGGQTAFRGTVWDWFTAP